MFDILKKKWSCSHYGWIVSDGVAVLHAGHKTGLTCTTVYLWMSQTLIFYSSWVACMLVEVELV
jgi:hypothetical protein